MDRLIEIAVKNAEKSIYKQRIGCVLVKGNKIISQGHNQLRYSSKNTDNVKWLESLHAERHCLNKVGREKAKGTTLIVVRILKDGSFALAKPCSQCMWLISELKVKKVVYSTKEGFNTIYI